MKLPGPRALAKTTVLSPPASVGNGNAIPPEEALLLQFLYTRQGSIFPSLARQFGIEYGLNIPYPSLRHALLAFASACLPTEQFAQSFHDNKTQCLRLLIPKLRSSNDLTETDIFASFVLLETLPENKEELFTHASGCITMVLAISDVKPTSRFFANISPWILSRASYLRMAYHEAPRKPVGLTELTECFTNLRMTAAPIQNWSPGPIEALNDFLHDLTWVTGKWFQESVFNELNNANEKKWTTDVWINYIKSQLTDKALLSVLRVTEQAFKNDYDGRSDPDQLMLAYQYARFNAIELMLGLCETLSALGVVRRGKPKVASAGMILRVRKFGLKLNGTQDVRLIVSLTGFGLSDDEASDSTSSTTLPLISGFKLSSDLQGRGEEKLAARLLTWWGDENLSNLYHVLTEALSCQATTYCGAWRWIMR